MAQIFHRVAERDLSRYKRREIHTSFASFCAVKYLRGAVHSFDFNGLSYDFYIRNHKADITLFSFVASIARKGLALPIFTGSSVFADLPMNVVLIADPALIVDKNLPLAWYSANINGVRTQDILKKAIKAINLALGTKKSIMFGSSGGGFAALYHSWHVPESLAFVINPQTQIKNYVRGYVEKYAQAFLTASGPDDVDRALANDTDSNLLPFYSSGFQNQILYLQNRSDWHVEKHMKPFMQACGRPVPTIIGD